jgi:hypothetical protein
MHDIKSSVLQDIMKWADNMSMNRIKSKKQPMDMEIQVHGKPEEENPAEDKLEGPKGEVAEEMPMGEPEEMFSLEDILRLEKEHKK